MTDYGSYKVHPLADDFPLIDGEEFDKLVADIRENGLTEKITLTHDGSTIVDGRNRYRACDVALRDPSFRKLPESFTEEQIDNYIVAENIHRRHLNAGQMAFLALKVEERAAERAKCRQVEGARQARENREANATKSQVSKPMVTPDLGEAKSRHEREAAAQAARAVGASREGVRQAKVVRDAAPDLATRVKSGALAIDNAYKQAKARIAEQRAREPEPAKLNPRRSDPIMLTLRTHAGAEVQYPQPSGKPTFNQTSGPGISWAEWSWNPVTGCLHGCDYCYAREIATGERYAAAYPVGFTPLFHHERLDAPTNTTIPAQYRSDEHVSCGNGGCKICAYRRVFVCSMADLYGRWVPDEWIDKVHTSMLTTPSWQYITLTKFPARYVGLEMPNNAWVGTSVDEQNRVRIAEEAFSKISGVKVKWLSLEPLREPLEFADLSMFDWVVIGAQTATIQPGGRVPAFAPEFEWVARLVSQAREAGCKVHLKPNLRKDPGMQMPDEYPGENESGDQESVVEPSSGGQYTASGSDESDVPF